MGSVGALLAELQTHYRAAGEASERYHVIEKKLTRQRRTTQRLVARLAEARAELADARNGAGRLARQRYRHGIGFTSFSPYVRMLLSDNPSRVLDEDHELRRADGRIAALEARLADTEVTADFYATRARQALSRQQSLADRRKRQRNVVRDRLATVQRLLASLSTDQLAAIRQLETYGSGTVRGVGAQAPGALFTPGALDTLGAPSADDALSAGGTPTTDRLPSAEGARAVRYAIDQVDMAYARSAGDPAAHDSAGFTARGWAHAGRDIPRTGPQQWRRLPHVPLTQLRPGDLVLYFPGATHAALYIGQGRVVHVPRPGAAARVSPIATNPLLGAVRPDAGRRALHQYTAPRLPGARLDPARPARPARPAQGTRAAR